MDCVLSACFHVLNATWCADQFHAASRMSSCFSIITLVTNHWPLPFSLEAYSMLWKNKRVQVRWLVEKWNLMDP